MPIRADALRIQARLPYATPFLPLLLERVMAAGARDCWTAPVTDYRGQPATELTVITSSATRDAVEEAILRNSPAREVIVTDAEISVIETSSEQVTTRWGDITITHRRWNGRIIEIEPDEEACLAYARQHDIPASTVWQEAYRIGEARIGQKR